MMNETVELGVKFEQAFRIILDDLAKTLLICVTNSSYSSDIVLLILGTSDVH